MRIRMILRTSVISKVNILYRLSIRTPFAALVVFSATAFLLTKLGMRPSASGSRTGLPFGSRGNSRSGNPLPARSPFFSPLFVPTENPTASRRTETPEPQHPCGLPRLAQGAVGILRSETP